MTLRSQLRTNLTTAGYPADQADEIVDLSMHIADRVAKVFPEIATLASTPSIELNVILVSSAIVINRVESARQTVLDILGEDLLIKADLT